MYVFRRRANFRPVVRPSVRLFVNIYPWCLVSVTPLTDLYRSFWNFACVFFMVWGCAFGLNIIVRSFLSLLPHCELSHFSPSIYRQWVSLVSATPLTVCIDRSELWHVFAWYEDVYEVWLWCIDWVRGIYAFMWTELLCIYVLRIASGPRVKLASCKSTLNPSPRPHHPPSLRWSGVSLTLCCFVVYSTRRFVLCLTLCYFVLVFFSPLGIAITSLGEERANLSAFRTFVDLRLFGFVCFLSSWCLERASVCDCGTPWTFLLPLFFFFFFFFFFCFFFVGGRVYNY